MQKGLTQGSSPRSADDESKLIIYQGANLTQLEVIFKSDHKTIQKKLFQNNVKPCGKRYGADIWYIHEVAPYIVKPAIDPDTYIRNMDPRDLPKMLTKEYWAGQRSKQEFEEKAGLLWRTEKIVEEMGEVFKLIKMSALLMLDGVERQTEVTERQRRIIKDLTHGMLNEAMRRIQERYKVPTEAEIANVQRQEEIDDEEI